MYDNLVQIIHVIRHPITLPAVTQKHFYWTIRKCRPRYTFVMDRLPLTLIALVFAILFPLIGFFAGVKPLYEHGQNWWRSRTSVAVPARVETLERVEHLSRKRIATYRTKATFRYTFEGHPFVGGQASFYDTPELHGGFQDKLYDELKISQQRQSVVDIWVDPGHPERAVFNRTLNSETTVWSLPFALLFNGFGLAAWGYIFNLWRPGRNKTMADRLREGPPILIKGTDGTALLFVFALAWNSFSWPFATIALGHIRANGLSLAVIAFLFPIAGLGLILLTWMQFRNRWLAGLPVLEITSLSPLRGSIHFRPGIGERSPSLELMHHITINLRLVSNARGGQKKPVKIWEHCLQDGPVARGTKVLDFVAGPPRERMGEELELVLELVGANYSFHLPRSR